MKALIVASANSGNLSPFVIDQINVLKEHGLEVDSYSIVGKGITGYLQNYKKLKMKIKLFKPDIVHAHYGLSGFLCILQFKRPVVVTFHGDDLTGLRNKFISLIVHLFSQRVIYVNNKMINKYFIHKSSLIPCGVDLKIFKPIDKATARAKMEIGLEKNVALFSSSFSRPEKNFILAKSAVELCKRFDCNIDLIELKDYNRNEVNLLLNAADVAIMTSIREASPQFIKEAMATNCPIVTTKVGDVENIIGKTENCYICEFDPNKISDAIIKVLNNNCRTMGRDSIKYFDNNLVALKIHSIYLELTK